MKIYGSELQRKIGGQKVKKQFGATVSLDNENWLWILAAEFDFHSELVEFLKENGISLTDEEAKENSFISDASIRIANNVLQKIIASSDGTYYKANLHRSVVFGRVRVCIHHWLDWV